MGGLTLPGYMKKMSYSNREAYVIDILPNCLLSFPVNEVHRGLLFFFLSLFEDNFSCVSTPLSDFNRK